MSSTPTTAQVIELPSKPLELLTPADARIDRDCESYIVKGLLERGDLGLLYGPSGAGKSFLALRLAWNVASGTQTFGARVRPSSVCYVTLEGAAGFHKRVYALHARWPLPEDTSFRFACLKAQDLALPEYRERLVQAVCEHRFDLVVIDTLARFLGDRDENTSGAMNHAIDFANDLHERAGAATLFVHHTGKDAAQGARGHSSLRAAVDLEMAVQPGKESGDPSLMSLTKVKDGESGLGFAVHLQQVDLGEDAEGDAITTLCVSELSQVDGESTKARPRPSPTEKLYLDAAHQFFAEGGGKKGHPMAEMQSQFWFGDLAEIAPLLERLDIGEVPIGPDEHVDPEAIQKRQSKNQKRAANNFARLANKGILAYADGRFWFPDQKAEH